MNNHSVIVKNLTKSFKIKKIKNSGSVSLSHRYENNRIVVLDNINFEVEKGEMLGIIGINGSGKTTLLRTIAGIYQPDSGNITVNGTVSSLLQMGTGFQNELNARDNIILSGMIMGMSKSEIKNRVEDIIKFAELEEFTNMKIKQYSSGMRSRLAFSTAIQINSDILLVDEILSVGDISFREKSFKAFMDFKKKGKTILFASHVLGVLAQVCDRIVLINQGKQVMIGKPQEVIEKYKEMVKN